MPPKKITAPGAVALQPLDTNQETLSLRGSKPEKKGHQSNTLGGGVGSRDQGHGNHPSTSAKEKRRRWLGWPIFKGRSTKLLKKCVILFKMNKTEGPNTGSFVKRAYSTKMDGMMILVMIPLLLMMLLPWQQNYRIPHSPIIQATSASHV
jgi:hypothetical protein